MQLARAVRLPDLGRVVLTALLVCTPPALGESLPAGLPDSSSASLLQRALSGSIAPGDSARLVEELRHKVLFDRHDLRSRRELAGLLGRSPDIELRREAMRALAEALLIDDSDPGLWIQVARLQERRGFQRESRQALFRALESNPGRADVWDELAFHQFRRFQTTRRTVFLDEALEASRRSLSLDPDNPAALRRGLRMAYILGERHVVDSLCTRWERVDPQSGWPRLVRGMLHADAGAWTLAMDAFRSGLARLAPEERKPFLRLDLVDPEEEELRRASPDTLQYFADYWRWRDPTPADAENPRLVEHYRRMMQAELLFALDGLGIHGWNHAPGQMIVRYGLPEGWSYRDDVVRVDEFRVSTAGLGAPSIRVRYGQVPPPLVLTFVDYNLNGRYFNPVGSFPSDLDFFFASIPSLYESLLGIPELDQSVEVWRFVDDRGKGRIQVGVALSPDTWSKDLLVHPYQLASRLTLYDLRWEVTDASVASWAGFREDPLGRLVGSFQLDGMPDSLILGLETEDRGKQAHAGTMTGLPPRRETDVPILSDIAFLSSVDFTATGGLYDWGPGSGIPNPGHLYRPGDDVGLAFEAYRLEQDADGNHKARLSISVGRQTRSGFLNVLLHRGQSPPEAELVFDATGPGARIRQLLTVDLPSLDPGRYVLRLRVRDLVASRSTEREASFVIVGPGKLQ